MQVAEIVNISWSILLASFLWFHCWKNRGTLGNSLPLFCMFSCNGKLCPYLDILDGSSKTTEYLFGMGRPPEMEFASSWHVRTLWIMPELQRPSRPTTLTLVPKMDLLANLFPLDILSFCHFNAFIFFNVSLLWSALGLCIISLKCFSHSDILFT